MQQMAAPGHAGCRHAAEAAPGAPSSGRLAARPLALAPARRRRSQQSQPTHVPQAFAGAAAPALSAGAGLSASTGLISFFSFALGGVGLVLLLADQARQPGPDPECSTCEGTGLVPCVCQRWSDGDRGCSICAGSGRMSCPSCGGGGTAVPIAARAQATRGTSLLDQQRRM